MNTTSRPVLIYFYDALCGWCFGFSPVINELKKKYDQLFDFEIYSGGLRVGNQVGELSVVAPYIKSAYLQVEKTCGVKFGEPFIRKMLNGESIVLDSMPTATALCIVKEVAPAYSFQFASMLHQMIYVEGRSTDDVDYMLSHAPYLKFNPADFKTMMESKKYQDAAQADFAHAHQFGITGYPAIILSYGAKYYSIAKGYNDFNTVSYNIESVLGK